MFSLAGPRAAALLEGLGAQGLLAGAQLAHAVFACAGAPVLAAAGSGLGAAFHGATLVADEAVAAELWARLLDEVGLRHGASHSLSLRQMHLRQCCCLCILTPSQRFQSRYLLFPAFRLWKLPSDLPGCEHPSCCSALHQALQYSVLY